MKQPQIPKRRDSVDMAGSEAGKPYWSDEDLAKMDTAFRQRMMTALAAGLECCATAVSTAAGTKLPGPKLSAAGLKRRRLI
jgi:hypothetical protein